MKTGYIFILAAIAVALVGGFRLWERPSEASTGSCLHFPQDVAIAALEHDLLSQDAAKFNKLRMRVGEINYHTADIVSGDTSISIPFSLAGKIPGDFIADVSCGDSHRVAYREL